MKLKLLILTLFAAVCTTAFADAGFEPAAPPLQPKAKKRAGEDPVALAVLADQLAAWGDAQTEPLALLLAAKIQHGLRVKDGSAPDAKVDTRRYQNYLERAAVLAGSDAEVDELIRREKETASRGTLRGLIQERGVLPAGLKKPYALTFKGGESAAVGLMLDTGANRAESDLDLYVYDDERRSICALEGPGVPEHCTWTPKETGKFLVEVVNRGRADTPYVIQFR